MEDILKLARAVSVPQAQGEQTSWRRFASKSGRFL
jgi:hypothetical protein